MEKVLEESFKFVLQNFSAFLTEAAGPDRGDRSLKYGFAHQVLKPHLTDAYSLPPSSVVHSWVIVRYLPPAKGLPKNSGTDSDFR